MVRDKAGPPARVATRREAPVDRPMRRAVRALWDNRAEPGFSADVLRYGVCSDCSLGSHGLRDAAQNGVHLCGRRLSGLRRWTRPALDPNKLPDRAQLAALDRQELERLGRIPAPLFHRRGMSRFEILDWSDALKLASRRMEDVGGRWSLLVDDHSSSNETLFALSRLAEVHGAQSVGLQGSSRSAVALDVFEEHLGHGAGTTSLSALADADLVVLWGSVLDGHPVLGKLLVKARAGGTRVVAVQTQEQGVAETLLLPSRLALALLPSRAVDRSYTLSAGSEAQQAWQLLGAVLEAGAIDRNYLAERTDSWPRLGSSAEDMVRSLGSALQGEATPALTDLAGELCGASRAVVVLGDGGPCPVEEERSLARAITALCLARGWLGRAGAGMLVAGGGAASQGARDLGLDSVSLSSQFSLPAGDGAKLVYCVGDGQARDGVTGYEAVVGFSTVPTRIHQGCYLEPSMLVGDAAEVLVLPVQSRFEQRGGSTVTSLDRWVRFGPEIQGHPVGVLRADWQIPLALWQSLPGQASMGSDLPDVVALREAMARAQPRYGPLAELRRSGDGFQWGGTTLYEDAFDTPDGRARLPWPSDAGVTD